jgi:hypothetical protein
LPAARGLRKQHPLDGYGRRSVRLVQAPVLLGDLEVVNDPPLGIDGIQGEAAALDVKQAEVVDGFRARMIGSRRYRGQRRSCASGGDVGHPASLSPRLEGPKPLVLVRVARDHEVDPRLRKGRQGLPPLPSRFVASEIHARHVIADELPQGLAGRGVASDLPDEPSAALLAGHVVHAEVMEWAVVDGEVIFPAGRDEQLLVGAVTPFVVAFDGVNRHPLHQALQRLEELRTPQPVISPAGGQVAVVDDEVHLMLHHLLDQRAMHLGLCSTVAVDDETHLVGLGRGRVKLEGSAAHIGSCDPIAVDSARLETLDPQLVNVCCLPPVLSRARICDLLRRALAVRIRLTLLSIGHARGSLGVGLPHQGDSILTDA